MSYRKKIAHWEGFAKTDPLWSILTDPDKKQGKWDVEEFFQTGADEIKSIFGLLQSESWMPAIYDKALDFGCGVGRLTRALSPHFKLSIGVDASAEMIRMAKQYHAGREAMQFLVNDTDNLSIIPDESVSFVYSTIVLQHIPTEQSYQFIAEFCRILQKGGTIVFQLPTDDRRQLSLLQKFRVWLKPRERLANMGLWKKYHMDMNVYDEKRINGIISSHKCTIVGQRLTNHTDVSFNGEVRFLDAKEATDFVSTLYIVRK